MCLEPIHKCISVNLKKTTNCESYRSIKMDKVLTLLARELDFVASTVNIVRNEAALINTILKN